MILEYISFVQELFKFNLPLEKKIPKNLVKLSNINHLEYNNSLKEYLIITQQLVILIPIYTVCQEKILWKF